MVSGHGVFLLLEHTFADKELSCPSVIIELSSNRGLNQSERWLEMKNYVRVVTVALMFLTLSGCESCSRFVKDVQSDIHGLERTATVYSQDGKVLNKYSGKFDVEVNEYGNKVKFDIDGKRVLIYNATVIIEEKEK